MHTVLLADGDKDLRQLLAMSVEAMGCRVIEAPDMQKGLEEFRNNAPTVVVADMALSAKNGVEFCKRVRQLSNAPLLFTSAEDHEQSVLAALEAGADAFLVKPFGVAIFVAQLKTMLRRVDSPTAQQGVIKVGGLALNLDRCSANVNGRDVSLTPTEFKLLCCLAANAGRVVSCRELLRYSHNYAANTEQQAQEMVRVHVRNLRSKIEPDVQNPRILVNVRGFGYMLDRRAAHRPDDPLARYMGS